MLARAGPRASWPPSTRRPTSTWSSTLEAEAASLAAELAAAEAEADGRRSARAAPSSRPSALGRPRGRGGVAAASAGPAVLGDATRRTRPGRASEVRGELVGPGARPRAAGHRRRWAARVGRPEQRHDRRAVPGRPAGRTAGELEQADGRACEAELAARAPALDAAACAGPRTAAGGGRRGRAGAAPDARRGPRRSSAALATPGRGGAELLRGVDGVVGSLLDLVEIDDGWEAAFEAAAGAAVAAVVVDGRRSAQAALATLRERGVTGAVLAPRSGAGRPSHRRRCPPGSSAEPVRPPRAGSPRRRGRPSRVLDALVGRAVRVDGWEEAIDLALARDDLVVVTPEGDRFAAVGLAGALGAPAWSPRPRSRRPAAAPRRRRPRPSAARARLHRAPASRWPRPATPAPRPSAAADRHASAREAAAADASSGRPRSGRGWPASSRRRGRRRGGASSAWPRSTAEQAAAGRLPARASQEAPRGAGHELEARRAARARPAPGARGAGGRAGGAAPRPGRAPGRGRAPPAGPRRGARHRGDAAGSGSRPRARPWRGSKRWSQREHDRLDGDLRVAAPRLPGPGRRGARRRRAARAAAPGPPHDRAAARGGAQRAPATLDLEINEVDLRTEALHEHIARELGATPEPSWPGCPSPRRPRARRWPQHAEELERKLARAGAGQPAGARGALRARGAAQGARGAGRRRAAGPPRAARGGAHARPGDHDVVRRRGRRRERALLDAGRHAVPGRHGPAAC